MNKNLKPVSPTEPLVFYKIRHRVTGLFKTGGKTNGCTTSWGNPNQGWSKLGKTWTKAGLTGHLALFKREKYEFGKPTTTYYAVPDVYEVLCFSSEGTVVDLETVLPRGATLFNPTNQNTARVV